MPFRPYCNAIRLNDRGLRTAADAAALKEFQKSENLEETGQLNPGTLAAIHEFQRSENLPVSGRPDRETLSALGISGPLAARQ